MSFSIINHQSSIINHQSSIINHQSSIINHQSSIINHQLTPQPPAVRLRTSESKNTARITNSGSMGWR
jgi:hypothetical protein